MGTNYINELERLIEELKEAKRMKDLEKINEIRMKFPELISQDILIHSYTDRNEIDRLQVEFNQLTKET
ncbi:MAG: hypothetical protein KDK36_07630 [Leptospiraceae bacterium]|nr:hypothetical protein [Leptospiraceae bacterium]